MANAYTNQPTYSRDIVTMYRRLRALWGRSPEYLSIAMRGSAVYAHDETSIGEVVGGWLPAPVDRSVLASHNTSFAWMVTSELGLTRNYLSSGRLYTERVTAVAATTTSTSVPMSGYTLWSGPLICTGDDRGYAVYTGVNYGQSGSLRYRTYAAYWFPGDTANLTDITPDPTYNTLWTVRATPISITRSGAVAAVTLLVVESYGYSSITYRELVLLSSTGAVTARARIDSGWDGAFDEGFTDGTSTLLVDGSEWRWFDSDCVTTGQVTAETAGGSIAGWTADAVYSHGGKVWDRATGEFTRYLNGPRSGIFADEPWGLLTSDRIDTYYQIGTPGTATSTKAGYIEDTADDGLATTLWADMLYPDMSIMYLWELREMCRLLAEHTYDADGNVVGFAGIYEAAMGSGTTWTLPVLVPEAGVRTKYTRDDLQMYDVDIYELDAVTTELETRAGG